MDSVLTSSQLWLLRLIAVIGLAFSLAVGSSTSVFAEESDQPSAEEEAVVSPPPYSGSKTATEPTDAEAWAVVDPNTGDVLNIIVCTQSMCGPGGGFGGKIVDGTTGIVGDLVRQGPSGQGGWRSGGGTSVTYEKESGSFRVEQKNGDVTNSFRVAPQAERDFVYKDIESSTTKKSGDTSATLRTFRPDFQTPWIDGTISFPDIGPNGSVLSYGLSLGGEEATDRPAALDRIAQDVDLLLIENGYGTTESTANEQTGEEENAVIVDAGNTFVVAIREVTTSLVEFLSSLLGFGQS